MSPKVCSSPHGFRQRLAALSEQDNLNQIALVELADSGITQLNRYETGASQPRLDVIRRLAHEGLILKHEAQRRNSRS